MKEKGLKEMWTRKNNIKEEGGKRGRKEQRNQERKRKEGNRVAGSYMVVY